jgi:hypothetical protein
VEEYCRPLRSTITWRTADKHSFHISKRCVTSQILTHFLPVNTNRLAWSEVGIRWYEGQLLWMSSNGYCRSLGQSEINLKFKKSPLKVVNVKWISKNEVRGCHTSCLFGLHTPALMYANLAPAQKLATPLLITAKWPIFFH